MSRDQGVAHLTVGDRSVDGVLDMKPLFVSVNHIGATPVPQLAAVG